MTKIKQFGRTIKNWLELEAANNSLVGLEYKKTKDLQDKIKLKRQVAEVVHKTSSASLLLVSLFGNPIISVVGWTGFQLLEKSSFIETFSDHAISWWADLSPTTKKTIVLGTAAATSITIILLATVIFQKSSGRGGVTILPKVTKLVAPGIEAEVVPEFCNVLWEYAKSNPFPPDFRIPQRGTSITFLTQLISLLNQKMVRGETINFVNLTGLYELLIICGQQGA